ncbi:uncharacterized protein [Solanum tuberosum]|uniref:Transmembrane protein n=1 Tax=Solanum tuberosum TaxID=4113 RepID=M0ZX21_SOLTU|nr:PREDICTED: uncharacterized protein LOC102589244 [Solanum tuberosum]KAH0632516.1 hypothetical protein KY284_035302 [Solanum tuberosum]KAH0638620.1 hypothetical protein KY285_035206 [Solanum tuberosum]
MVCVACLIPLFLVPIVNLLPVLFHILMAKVYRMMGKEYQRPERAPPACPFKPSATKPNNSVTGEEPSSGAPHPVPKAVGVDDSKQD